MPSIFQIKPPIPIRDIKYKNPDDPNSEIEHLHEVRVYAFVTDNKNRNIAVRKRTDLYEIGKYTLPGGPTLGGYKLSDTIHFHLMDQLGLDDFDFYYLFTVQSNSGEYYIVDVPGREVDENETKHSEIAIFYMAIRQDKKAPWPDKFPDAEWMPLKDFVKNTYGEHTKIFDVAVLNIKEIILQNRLVRKKPRNKPVLQTKDVFKDPDIQKCENKEPPFDKIIK